MKTENGGVELRAEAKSAPTPSPSQGLVQLRPQSDRNYTNPVRVLGVSAVVVVSGSPDRQMAAVAAAQRGRVSLQQLRTVGLTRRMIRTRVDRGALHVLHRGVYAVGHSGPVEFGDETAALLAYGHGSALSHRSAIWLWNFLREDPEEVHLISRPGASAKRRPGVYVHRSKTLSLADITTRKGLPVVTPALALLQFAESGADRELEQAVDQALVVRAVSRTKLRETIATHGPGRRGVRYLAELVDGGRPSSVTRSEAEERLRDLILTAGLPTPEMNHPLHGFVADFHWPQADYVVEFDGFAYHSSRSAWRRDRVKDRTFAANGIQLDRFTWEDITQQPLATVAHISRQLTARALGLTVA